MVQTLELKRSNLVLPTSGCELDREEMCYVEGGGAVLIGKYSSSNMSGIKYLRNQVTNYGVFSVIWFVAAVFFAFDAAIAAAPTFGVGAAVFGALAILCAAVGGILWGLSASANTALNQAIHYSDEGKSYSIYRDTGFLGFTSSWSVYAA
ncbi:MAG: hypothetical protein LBT20_06490 [Clostridiales bacterium]|nr:hypothetical protein [Clostridiales bacterium]